MSYQSFQFVVRRGPQEGQVFPLADDKIILGRDPMSDITLADAEVSRQHARLTRTADGGFEIQDLGSTNGTFVDGNRLGGENVRLAPGQIVVVGSNVTLVYEALPEQTATIVASRDELGLDDFAADEPPVFAPAATPEPLDSAATDTLDDEPTPVDIEPMPIIAEAAPVDADATIIDHSFDQPAYPVFTPSEPEPDPVAAFSAEPEPLPSFDDSWSTPSSSEDKGMPEYEPASASAPPPPPPPTAGQEPAGDDSNRNRILIAVVAVILLCCCCSLIAGGWFQGDAVMQLLGF